MKKFLLTFILLFISSCSCNTNKEIGEFEPDSQFYKETVNAQYVIDSICKADTLLLDNSNFKKWNKMPFYSSDSVYQYSYWFYDENKRVMISVSEAKDNKYIIKMIRE